MAIKDVEKFLNKINEARDVFGVNITYYMDRIKAIDEAIVINNEKNDDLLEDRRDLFKKLDKLYKQIKIKVER